jgi:hypothetical protein
MEISRHKRGDGKKSRRFDYHGRGGWKFVETRNGRVIGRC